MAAITVHHETADRFRISIRGHDLIVDQPPPASGDEGPTPTELFVASLAACAGFYARRFLARHGLTDGELVVGCDFGWAADHSRVVSVAMRVELPAGFPEALEAPLLRAIERCTVHASIRQTPLVTCEIVPARSPEVAASGRT